VSDKELAPELAVIIPGLIVRGGLVWVKEIVGGYEYLDPKNKFAS
jgi:hypothetical protein